MLGSSPLIKGTDTFRLEYSPSVWRYQLRHETVSTKECQNRTRQKCWANITMKRVLMNKRGFVLAAPALAMADKV